MISSAGFCPSPLLVKAADRYSDYSLVYAIVTREGPELLAVWPEVGDYLDNGYLYKVSKRKGWFSWLRSKLKIELIGHGRIEFTRTTQIWSVQLQVGNAGKGQKPLLYRYNVGSKYYLGHDGLRESA